MPPRNLNKREFGPHMGGEMRSTVLTNRREFVRGATASCIAIASLKARGFDGGAAPSLPNSVYAYEFGEISPEQQAGFAREYGFEGTVFDHARQIPERLRALDEAHLQLFFLWLTVDISNGQTKYEPGMEAAIEALQGRGTVLWVAIQQGDSGSGPGGEERAIQAIDRICDLASRSNLRVALYPHYGFYLARFRDVVRLAERVGRSNVGVTFNLCHELRSGFDPQFPQLLDKAMPRLYGVTINGADRQGKDWDTLIQPLGRGDYDVTELVRTITKAGYRGPFGIQCYGLKGDPGVYLKQSMAAWRVIASRS
jgi:sugar phosphate isomerase/epimerase